jgi:hypothetical protein
MKVHLLKIICAQAFFVGSATTFPYFDVESIQWHSHLLSL